MAGLSARHYQLRGLDGYEAMRGGLAGPCEVGGAGCRDEALAALATDDLAQRVPAATLRAFMAVGCRVVVVAGEAGGGHRTPIWPAGRGLYR